MLRRLLRRPLYIHFTDTNWKFLNQPRFRHHIKILMAVAQLSAYDAHFHPGTYEVKLRLVKMRPTLVFDPINE